MGRLEAQTDLTPKEQMCEAAYSKQCYNTKDWAGCCSDCKLKAFSGLTVKCDWGIMLPDSDEGDTSSFKFPFNQTGCVDTCNALSGNNNILPADLCPGGKIYKIAKGCLQGLHDIANTATWCDSDEQMDSYAHMHLSHPHGNQLMLWSKRIPDVEAPESQLAALPDTQMAENNWIPCTWALPFLQDGEEDLAVFHFNFAYKDMHCAKACASLTDGGSSEMGRNDFCPGGDMHKDVQECPSALSQVTNVAVWCGASEQQATLPTNPGIGFGAVLTTAFVVISVISMIGLWVQQSSRSGSDNGGTQSLLTTQA